MRLICGLAMVVGLTAAAGPINVGSPDGKSLLTVELNRQGRPEWSFKHHGKTVIRPSGLGVLRAGFGDVRKDCLVEGFTVTECTPSDISDTTWETVWGEERLIRDRHREVFIALRNMETGRKLNLRFRVFDDGVGFRYEIPVQPDGAYWPLGGEWSDFTMPGDPTVWWIPTDYDTQEWCYTKSRMSEIPELYRTKHFGDNSSTSRPDVPGVQTAVMVKLGNGLYVNLHEAACIDYPTMHLSVNGETKTFCAFLTPDRTGYMGQLQLPFNTPWRTVIVGEKAADILASRITLNLNEPCKLKDTSWIKPMKYMGVWWAMITGRAEWNYAMSGEVAAVDLEKTDFTKLKRTPKHEANTANVKRYLDFAGKHGFQGLLVEGWNIGWEDWFGHDKFRVFDFITPYPDFDVDAIQRYAASRGVKMIMHHETSGSVINYERWLERAYRFMNEHGYPAVKSGYVGNIVPYNEHHYTQFMNNHYLHCIKRAADYHIMVNAHEATRPTGICRTYPNWIGNESARGGEYEWFAGNPPEHTVILPFTRFVGGPMDYTPGLFEFSRKKIRPDQNDERYIPSTLAGQLGLMVTLYSPLQMACDRPEVYEQHLDAFKFIEDVPVEWEESRYLEAEVGEYVTTARRRKGGADWYLGSKNGPLARTSKVTLDFLTAGKTYEATIYQDANDANITGNNDHYRISRRTVKKDDWLAIYCPPGGGYAVSFKPVEGK